jgi:hypothetical protein
VKHQISIPSAATTIHQSQSASPTAAAAAATVHFLLQPSTSYSVNQLNSLCLLVVVCLIAVTTTKQQ